MILLTVHFSLAIAETPFAATFIVTVEITRESSRCRELVLRSWVEVVRGWAWEVGIDSRGTVVVNGCSIGGFAAEPGDFVRLLHIRSRL